MRSFILLIAAFIITVITFILLVGRRVILDGSNIPEYFQYIAVSLDKLWCYMIWRVKDHTVSAMVYELNKQWAIKGIDWLFKDEPNHCYEQWKIEFNK